MKRLTGIMAAVLFAFAAGASFAEGEEEADEPALFGCNLETAVCSCEIDQVVGVAGCRAMMDQCRGGLHPECDFRKETPVCVCDMEPAPDTTIDLPEE